MTTDRRGRDRDPHGSAGLRVVEPAPRDAPLAAGDLLWTLRARRWTILACALAGLALAGAYLLAVPPRFRVQAILHVEDRPDTVPGLEAISASLGLGTRADSELEVLRSRALLEEVVRALHLDLEARPRQVPLLGAAAARLRGGEVPAPPPLGLLGRYAWGGERLSLERLEVPAALLDQPLVLTALPDGGFRLVDAGGLELAAGRAGAQAGPADPARPVVVHVAELVARPGTEFVVTRRPPAAVAAALQNELRVELRGRHTGLVSLELEGRDPARLVATVNELSRRYLERNAGRAKGHLERMLGLLEAQLPALRRDVERAESAFRGYQAKHGTVNLPAETQAAVDRAVAIERGLSELEVERASLLERYTDRYPAVADLTQRIEALRRERNALELRTRALPGTELGAARLTRDLQVSTALYLQVLEHAQQLRIAVAGSAGTARMVDPAVAPHAPLGPPARVVLALGLLLGLGAGAALVVARERGSDRVTDGDAIEAGLDLPVLAVVPHSAREVRLARRARRGRGAVLASAAPDDLAVEDLRGLRTSLASALRKTRSRVVSLNGPAPGSGKSFVCANVAHLLAAAGKRVLVVDADLRRGTQHRRFGVEREPGLAEVLAGAVALDAAIRPSGVAGVDLVTAGSYPADPTALLERPALKEVLAEAERRYDLVLVDTPAILAVTDPAIVARHAGVSLLVVRAGEHPLHEIELAVKRLGQGGAEVSGVVLNDVRETSRRYGRYGRYRRYAYGTRRAAR